MCLNPKLVKVRMPGMALYEFTEIPVKCGKCIECCKQYSNDWSYRIIDECSHHKDNCMVTLTYNNENCPSNGVLKRDVQLFMKRLRKALHPQRVRYFACGEYGSLRGRPHYHIILFGFKPLDLKFLKVDKKGTTLYTSEFISSLWQKGFISVGDVNLDSAKYCAKYMQKYIYGLSPSLRELNPSFTLMSTKPGIGYNAVYDQPNRDSYRYYSGKQVSEPRYYFKVEERDGIYLDERKSNRIKRAKFYFKKNLKNP